MLTESEIRHALAQFTGTEQYHAYNSLGAKFKLTDGVKFLARAAACCWLLDAIGSYQPQLKNCDFQVWTLTRKDDSVRLVCTDGDYCELAKQEIPYTDIVLSTVRLYVIDGVVLLPSEY